MVPGAMRGLFHKQGRGWEMSRMMKGLPIMISMLALPLAVISGPALAGEADVVSARATHGADGTWRFEVTIRHADTGWDHYADRFEIIDPKTGRELARRVLFHPHVNEQPFTRSLTGARLPKGQGEVLVRAHDKVHGHGGREVLLKLSP